MPLWALALVPNEMHWVLWLDDGAGKVCRLGHSTVWFIITRESAIGIGFILTYLFHLLSGMTLHDFSSVDWPLNLNSANQLNHLSLLLFLSLQLHLPLICYSFELSHINSLQLHYLDKSSTTGIFEKNLPSKLYDKMRLNPACFASAASKKPGISDTKNNRYCTDQTMQIYKYLAQFTLWIRFKILFHSVLLLEQVYCMEC